MPRDEDYTREKLQHLLPKMRSAAVKGIRESMDDYTRTAHKLRKTTGRSIARDHIVDNLRDELMFDPDVSIKDRNQTTYFEIHGEFRVLAKMANDAGNVALNANQASFSFQENGESDLFASDDLPEATNLYLSYVPNSRDPRNPFVYVTCPKAGGHHWRFELEPPALDIAGEIGGTSLPDEGQDDLVRVPSQDKPEESE